MGSALTEFVHAQATEWFQRYAMVGGMPGVVALDLEGSARRCREAQIDLVAAFREDFSKYAGRREPRQLDKVLVSIAAQLGSKFVYSHVDQGMRHTQAKVALELLLLAQLCSPVVHTSARGAPLAAGAKASDFKVFLLDIGLVHALLRTPAAARFPPLSSLPPALRGQLTEQLVAQALRSAFDPSLPQELYYWHRTGGRAGEIDFVTQGPAGVLPVEVKAGRSGAMKALHQFMAERSLPLAVRFDENPPSLQDVSVTTTQSLPASYRLLSLPHYLAWNLGFILEAWQ